MPLQQASVNLAHRRLTPFQSPMALAIFLDVSLALVNDKNICFEIKPFPYDYNIPSEWMNWKVPVGAPCRKVRWTRCKQSSDIAQQDEIPRKSTILAVRHNFHVVSEVTLHYYCKTLRYYKRRIFSLISCEVLRHAATFFASSVWYIIKHLFHEYLRPIDPFTKRHRLVHIGWSSKFEALYGSLNMVNSTEFLVVVIPLGTDCASLPANLSLFLWKWIFGHYGKRWP